MVKWHPVIVAFYWNGADFYNAFKKIWNWEKAKRKNWKKLKAEKFWNKKKLKMEKS